MKKTSTLILMLAITLVSFAQVTVTINLDMRGTDYDESTEDLYYSGDFNEWATPGTDDSAKFTDNGNGTYTVSFDSIMPGYFWNDFYRENDGGSGWGTNGEWPGAPTGVDAMIYVGDVDVTFESKWGDVYNETLSVNMNDVEDFDSSEDTVYYINENVGTMNKTVMTDDDANGIYTITWDTIPQVHLACIFAYGSASAAIPLVYEWSWSDDSLGTRLITVENEDVDRAFKFGDAEDWTSSISKHELANVPLYPNPSSTGIVNIELDGSYNVTIMDITGKIIYSDVIDQNGSVDLSNNPKGVYFACFFSSNKVTTQKIVLQ